MMQSFPLKWRVWVSSDNDCDKMVYPNCKIFTSGLGFPLTGSFDKDKVMWHIGFVDWKNKDIYAGDIVRVTKGGNVKVYEVKWSYQAAGYYFAHGGGYITIEGCAQSHGENFHMLDNVEVIGNVFEHPELLK